MENKTGKYFKYAIGEIMLVVIGILIALSINNWNENRKLEKDKFKLMLALKQEFLSNKNELENQYNGLKTSNGYLNKLIHFSADSTTSLPVDSLRLYSSKMAYLYQLSLLNSVQEEAISSGKFEMLNDSLKGVLSKYKDYSNALNTLIENSALRKFDDESTELAINLSTFQSMFDLSFPNRTIPIHAAFRKNDTDFVTYLKLPKTYKMLYAIYYQNMMIELWVNQGLLNLCNKILEEIDEQLML